MISEFSSPLPHCQHGATIPRLLVGEELRSIVVYNDPRQNEPVPDHLADTGPIRTIDHLADTGPMRPVVVPLPAWRRFVGLISLLGAAALTLATVFLLTRSTGNSVSQNPPNTQNTGVSTAQLPTKPPPTATPAQPTQVGQMVVNDHPAGIPVVDPSKLVNLLNAPLQAAPSSQDAIEVLRNSLDPFTRIPQRARAEVETYTVQSGDTFYTIAQNFGLTPETIAWSNPNKIDGLQPGDPLFIMPVDGVYYTVIGGKTIAQIAADFSVDPYTIIDSEYNNLFGDTPDTALPSGTQIAVPGGVGQQIAWTPAVQRSGSDSNGGGGTIIFDPGDPGSCGAVANPGGGTGWSKPLTNSTWMRGFSSWHSGVDLADPIGTPVMAANSGAVIFAGWNSFGYGYAVVLAHGPFETLYGHLSSIAVSCGNYVNGGQVIAYTGNSGNSTGPHLHFEIRYGDTPTDPTSTIPLP
jgi:murein DD-endopeptidase MepM/ murein hydrolase activator NlpD